jgi:hypothetical protein
MNWKRFGRKRSWPLRYHPGIHPERLRKLTKNLNQDSRESNPGPREYDAQYAALSLALHMERICHRKWREDRNVEISCTVRLEACGFILRLCTGCHISYVQSCTCVCDVASTSELSVAVGQHVASRSSASRLAGSCSSKKPSPHKRAMLVWVCRPARLMAIPFDNTVRGTEQDVNNIVISLLSFFSHHFLCRVFIS